MHCYDISWPDNSILVNIYDYWFTLLHHDSRSGYNMVLDPDLATSSAFPTYLKQPIKWLPIRLVVVFNALCNPFLCSLCFLCKVCVLFSSSAQNSSIPCHHFIVGCLFSLSISLHPPWIPTSWQQPSSPSHSIFSFMFPTSLFALNPLTFFYPAG